MSDKMTFKKATRDQLKAMIALSGSSGSGKTFTALRMARGLVGPNGRIGLIDTEHGRSQIYAQEFDFETLDLEPPFTPERYIRAIEAGEEAGFDALIVDGASHEWAGKGGILEQHDLMEGNSYTNWAVLTPRHTAFLDRLTRCKVHLFVTLRGKDEYVLEQNDKGKQQPKKVGLGPVQRAGIEYEFMVSFMLDQIRHTASVMKDNTHLFENVIEVLTEEHGRKLAEWCSKGVDPKERAKPYYLHLDELVRHHEKKLGEAVVLETRKAMGLHDADIGWLERQAKRLETKYGTIPDTPTDPTPGGNGKETTPAAPAATPAPAEASAVPTVEPVTAPAPEASATAPAAVDPVAPSVPAEWQRLLGEITELSKKLDPKESDDYTKETAGATSLDALISVYRKLLERVAFGAGGKPAHKTKKEQDLARLEELKQKAEADAEEDRKTGKGATQADLIPVATAPGAE